VNQAKHTLLYHARLAELGDLNATRNYLRLARLARAEGLPELVAYRVEQAQAARRSWHRNRGVLLRHFHGRRARGRA
jgi:rubrerythrin